MTRNYGRLFALLVSLLLVASVAVPGAVAGAVAEDEDDDLTLEVTQDHDTGEVLVTLADNTTDTVNATLDVSGDPYEGNGTYEFPADGSLTLNNSSTSATVTFYAETNDTRNVTLADYEVVPLEDSLSVSVNQTADGVDVLVEQYGEPVEGATVNASATDENETYEGADELTTDANGTVTFDNPASEISVDFEATYNDLDASATETLDAYGLYLQGYQDVNNSVVITVEYDGEPVEGANVTVEGENYSYAGDYDTDANGTVELNPPANDTVIDVTAEYDGMTAQITDWMIQASEEEGDSGFAKALVKYIEFIKMEELDVPRGHMISAFVHENNPSSADDDAGPPEHAGPKNSVTASSNNSTHGPPDWAGPKNKSTDLNATAQSGPPDHAKKNKDKNKNKGNNGNGHGNPHVTADEENETDA